MKLLVMRQRKGCKKEHQKHMNNKQCILRDEKENDKKNSTDKPSYVTAVFYLADVLPCPSDDTSIQSTLAVYNRTICMLNSNQGYCFIWDKTTAGKGALSVYKCINKMANKRKKEISTDVCGASTEVDFVITCIYMRDITLIESITHKSFESGLS